MAGGSIPHLARRLRPARLDGEASAAAGAGSVWRGVQARTRWCAGGPV